MPNKLLALVDQVIFRGNLFLPLPVLKKIIYPLVIPLALLFALFHQTRLLGNLALNLLTLAIFIRPAAAVFPTFGLLKLLLALRRQIGVASAIFIFGHLFSQSSPLSLLQAAFLAGPRDFTFWGLLGFLVLIPIFLTSNDTAVRLLGKNWKKVHFLIHPLYIFALIHRGLQIGYFGLVQAVFVLAALYSLRFLARRRVTLLTHLTSVL